MLVVELMAESEWSQDLVCWDESDIEESGSINEATAELAACFGHDLVNQTILSFS